MENPLPRPAVSPTPDKARDPWWDNTRFVSASLIVVLHTVGSLMSRHDGLGIYHVGTWAFRVPMFVMLAGVFSSGDALGPRRLRTLLQSIVVPALIFSLLYSLEVKALGGAFTLHITQLPWTLWFLMSLFFWRLLLPLVVQLRHPLLVTTAVSLAVGYEETFGMQFSASRTLVYMPLFYLGWRLGQGTLKGWFEARWSLPVAVTGIAAWFTVAWLWHERVSGTWLSMRHPYTAATDTPLSMEGAWVVRLMVLATAAGLVLCLLRVIPRRRLPFVSLLGSGGFTIYLLHPLVLLPLREKGYLERADTRLELLGLMAGAVLLAAVLGSPRVRKLVQPLTRPPIGRLFAPMPGAAPSPGPTPALSGDTLILSKRL